MAQEKRQGDLIRMDSTMFDFIRDIIMSIIHILFIVVFLFTLVNFFPNYVLYVPDLFASMVIFLEARHCECFD